jgi:hypothetical protein
MLRSPSVLLTSLLTAMVFVQFIQDAKAKTVPTNQNSNIFVLNGADLPFSPQSEEGEQKVFDREQQYMASMGIDLSLEAKKKVPRTITVTRTCCGDKDDL